MWTERLLFLGVFLLGVFGLAAAFALTGVLAFTFVGVGLATALALTFVFALAAVFVSWLGIFAEVLGVRKLARLIGLDLLHQRGAGEKAGNGGCDGETLDGTAHDETPPW